ncbi:hypothetical protein COM45_04820 [Corynebacterium accolens]|uniref:Uncharacterized protein n=1 Tax=Corynebacterium accolens TaxID=38284 RepID=A0A2A4AKX4_9CORY|nr:hypothetical protein COM45_04820 [Corynebacterium accolens]
MPNTIEVPISLIKAGDMDAIRELLPKENLFGRWATNPTLGRGIIISEHPDQETFVKFANGKSWSYVAFDNLTFDPVELITMKDFRTAPEGTIVAAPTGNAFQKVSPERWENHLDLLDDKQMAISGPYKILRYGWGE